MASSFNTIIFTFRSKIGEKILLEIPFLAAKRAALQQAMVGDFGAHLGNKFLTSEEIEGGHFRQVRRLRGVILDK